MKARFLVPLVSLVACVASNGGVVTGTNLNLGGAGDVIITAGPNTPLATGIAQAGFFTAGFDVNAAVLSADYTSLYANFTSLASTNFGDPTLLGPTTFGLYLASEDYGAPGTIVPLGAQLYTFFGTGLTLETSLAIGLIQHPETVGADTPSPDSNDLLPNTGTVLIGTSGTITYDFGEGNVTTPNLNLLVVIPEPSTALLGAVGALGLLRRRRN